MTRPNVHRDDESACQPVLSIIVYFIKPAPFLNDTLMTIVSQLTDATELIVVAGEPDEHDLGINSECRSRIARLIVERDHGAWDAANKGWQTARGRWIQFVMADDYLPAGSVTKTLAALQGEQAEVLSGGMSFFVCDGENKERIVRSVPAQPLTLERVLGDLCAPAVVYQRAFLERIGGFDGHYRYSHDRELLLRAWQLGARCATLPHEMYKMRIHGQSRTTSGRLTVIEAYLAEHVAFGDRLLHEADLTSEARRTLQRWRDEELVKRLYMQGRYTPSGNGAGSLTANRTPVTRMVSACIRLTARRARRVLRSASHRRT